MKVMNEFTNVIQTEAELIYLLSTESESFNLSHCRFECDIDLFSIVKENSIAGIILKDDVSCRPRMERSDLVKELEPSFYCANLIFEKKVNFHDSIFAVYADFENTIFEHGVNLISTEFTKDVQFNTIETKSESVLGFKSNSNVLLKDSTIILNVKNHSKLSIEGNFLIENTRFASDVNLNYSVVKGQLSFSNVIFDGELNLSNSSIGQFILTSSPNDDSKTEIKKLSILETEFFDQIQFNKVGFNNGIRSKGAVFHDNLYFNNVNFRGKNFFNHTIFHKSIIITRNVTVETHFSFYGATFNANIDLKKLDFTNAYLSFVASHINANLWLGRRMNESTTIFRGIISFNGATISAGSIIRVIGLNHVKEPEGKISFANGLIKGLVDFGNVYLKEVNFNGTIVQGNIQDNNTLSSAIKDRRTARLLKHEAKKINDMISATSYQKIEMNTFYKDLTWSYRNIDEKLILCLNKLSNNHGTNWLLGVPFTVVSGLIFYTAFTLSYSNVGWIWEDQWNFLLNDEDFWSGFINFVWLPSGFEKLSNNGIVYGGVCGAFFFILGKIAIAYGIYQTIAAFRKHIK